MWFFAKHYKKPERPMSARGPERKWPRLNGMSVLPQVQTSSGHPDMSVSCLTGSRRAFVRWTSALVDGVKKGLCRRDYLNKMQHPRH
jgi:hypothetical protein